MCRQYFNFNNSFDIINLLRKGEFFFEPIISFCIYLVSKLIWFQTVRDIGGTNYPN